MEKNSNIDGILVVDKPTGCTSRDVVNRLTHIFNTKKIGHTGTLDPLASGVLVCTLGKCTKLNEFLTSTFKEYHVEFVLGFETDTLDITGKQVKTSKKVVNDAEINKTIHEFVCTYMQEVPLYSAVKINGKKLYEYARCNEKIEPPKREVIIESIKNININKKDVSFDCKVSKGTYIRSLVRDIGNCLGTYATMTNLKRLSQGNFSIDEANSLEDIQNGNYKILTKEEVLKDIYSIEVDENLYKKVTNGAKLDLPYEYEYITFTRENNILCLYKKENGIYRLYVMF